MSEGLIYLQNVRLSFPNIAAPKAQTDGGVAKYGADFLMPPDHPGFAKFLEAANALAFAKWKENTNAVLQMVWADRKARAMGQGHEKVNTKTLKMYDGYEGMVYISAYKDKMPQIIKADGSPIDPADTLACQAEARRMYGGCRVNAVVKPWIQENKHGRGIRCDFVAIQFFKDDTAFGEGNIDASGLFGAAPAAQAPAAGAAPPWMTPGAPAMPPAPFPGAVTPGMPPGFPTPPLGVAPAGNLPPTFAPPAAPGLPSFLQ